MSDRPTDDLERRLEALPREAWDRPVPPPAPWPPEQPWRVRAPGFSLRPLTAALAAAALIALGVAGGVLVSGGEDSPDTVASGTTVALAPLGDADPTAAGEATLTEGETGEAVVEVSGLAPSGDSDFYELWLIGEDGELVSLGSFRVPGSGEAKLRVPVPVDPSRFSFVDVSLEPDDGDPGHSSDSVLRGPTT